jgi:hypothetical protein
VSRRASIDFAVPGGAEHPEIDRHGDTGMRQAEVNSTLTILSLRVF